jgi:hypothetical protein
MSFRPILALAAAVSLTTPALAQGDLLVAPTRLVLNGGGSTEVVLSNIGADTATYRIGLELRRMNADGQLQEVTEANASPAERAALDMIRYSPRRITLAPNQPQSVRLSARPPAELPDGEYRVHMSFRAAPDAKPVEAPTNSSATGLSIRLTPIYGVTIPVIVRKGQLAGGATIADPVLVHEGTMNYLKLDIARSGERSVYGEIRVMAPGTREPVFVARGIAVYAELSARRVKLPMSAEQAAKLKGPLKVEYREMPENGAALIAQTAVNF